jgi:lipoprotein-releasing system permease protein
MSLGLSFRIAKTHLLSRKAQTIIASLGVTFGISMFVVMMAVMTGVNVLLTETMLESTPHIRLYNDINTDIIQPLDKLHPNAMNIIYHIKPKREQDKIKDAQKYLSIIKENPEVWGVSPNVSSQIFFNYGMHKLPGVLKGTNILEEAKLIGLEDKIISGDMRSLLSTNNGIIIGSGLSKKFRVNVGDKINITTPNGTIKLMKIVAIMKTGISQIDNSNAYANFRTVQSLLGKNKSEISEINIKLYDAEKAAEIATKLETITGADAEDWKEANATILESFVLRNFITYTVVITILIVAGFGIYNIMNMTVYDKIKDIAILNAIGFERASLITIFIFQSLIIGISGGILGLGIGRFLVYLVSKVEMSSDEFVTIDAMPINNDPMFYIFGLLFGVVTTFFAGYFPARKASKLDPVEIIRGK